MFVDPLYFALNAGTQTCVNLTLLNPSSCLATPCCRKKKEEFTGYDMYDLIVDKFDVPYDVQINKTVWMGKPVLCFNIMWK